MSSQVLNAISIILESVWGTPLTPDKSMPVNFTGGIQTVQDIQMVNSVTSRLAQNQDAFIGNRTHEGDLEFPLNPDWVGYFMLTAFGAVDTVVAGGESIVFDHTFSEAEDKPSLTIEQAIGENVRRYAGAIASSFSISGTPGEVVNATVAMMARTQATASAITPVYTDTPVFNFANASVEIDSSAIGEMQNFTITYVNNSNFKHVLNNNDPEFKWVGGSEITGSFEMYLNSTTSAEITKYLNKTESAIDLILTGPETIGSASNYGLTISIPRAVYTTTQTPLAEGHNLVTIEFSGLYDTGSSSLVTAVLTNLVTAYS